MQIPIEAILFALLIAMAIVIGRMRDLFAAAMLTGMFSLMSAGLFTLMDAVDVAFTEAAVGAGVSTVLLLGTLSVTRQQERMRPTRPLPLMVVLFTGAALLWGTLDMPAYGDPNAFAHNDITRAFIQGTAETFEIPNAVTAVLGSYRGYDTLGETTVIFAAIVGVMAALGRSHTQPGHHDPVEAGPDAARSHMRMRDKAILRVIAKAFIPFILLFGLYVQFHGDFGPGGGFQAGVIVAAGFVLYGLIFGLDNAERVAPPRIVEIGAALGVLLFAGTGIVNMLQGGMFLDYSTLGAHAGEPMTKEHITHGLHRGLLLIEGGVGITVACSILMIFYQFSGRGRH
ncbi:DUF4040 domain-containing protein [Myxococcota bacterium]|nr:DUF4040 domain-containing protein [Myxococcota bacterium]